MHHRFTFNRIQQQRLEEEGTPVINGLIQSKVFIDAYSRLSLTTEESHEMWLKALESKGILTMRSVYSCFKWPHATKAAR